MYLQFVRFSPDELEHNITSVHQKEKNISSLLSTK